MAYQILYPDEKPMVNRHSSINQFDGLFSVKTYGGWTPIMFDQLDGITCETVKTHPVAVSFSDFIGYVYPEAGCSYVSDKYIYFDREGVEERKLPPCFGTGGDFYMAYVRENSFAIFDNNTSVGTHNTLRRRVGLSYVKSDETLPAVD